MADLGYAPVRGKAQCIAQFSEGKPGVDARGHVVPGHLADKGGKEPGKHKGGKAGTYDKRLSDIDLAVLEKLLAGSVAERKRNHAC